VFNDCLFYTSLVSLPAYSGSRPLIQFRNHFSQSVGLRGRVISPSHGRYIHTGQHKHKINAHRGIHLSGIRTHDPSIQASEDSSCLRPCGYCERLSSQLLSGTTSNYNSAQIITTHSSLLSLLHPPRLCLVGVF
jgi:hypothetical protein